MRLKWFVRYVPTMFLTITLGATNTHGQTKTEDMGAKQAMTQRLFERGSQAMGDKRFAEACGLFEKVIELAPDGIGGHEALGQCYRDLGHLGSAWAQYMVAETLALASGDKQRSEMLAANRKDLENRAATITITVTKSLKNIQGLRIFVDDVPEEKVLWNTPRPVDVGKHVVRVEAPDRHPWSKEFHIAKDGSNLHLVVPPDLNPTKAAIVVNQEKRISTPTNWQRPVGWSGLAIGGTSLVASGILASLAVGTQNTSLASGHCPSVKRCDADGLAMREQAQKMANGATATFVLGSLFAGAGLVLLLVAPKENKEQERSGKTTGLSLSTTISPMGFGFQGTW